MSVNKFIVFNSLVCVGISFWRGGHKQLTPALKIPVQLQIKVSKLQRRHQRVWGHGSTNTPEIHSTEANRQEFQWLRRSLLERQRLIIRIKTCSEVSNSLTAEPFTILTSLRAFSSFGLLSSTLSLDCCFNLRSIAVTEEENNSVRNRPKSWRLEARGQISYIGTGHFQKVKILCLWRIPKHIFAHASLKYFRQL